ISPQHWAYQSITELSSLHIIKGQTDQIFGVKKYVTEAELVTMLVRINNLNKRIEPQRMNGLPWYDPYVASANEQALIKLDSFHPNQVMTRQEVVAWVDQ